MEAAPVLAAAVVLSHVTRPSGLFTPHPFAGKLVVSNPSTVRRLADPAPGHDGLGAGANRRKRPDRRLSPQPNRSRRLRPGLHRAPGSTEDARMPRVTVTPLAPARPRPAPGLRIG